MTLAGSHPAAAHPLLRGQSEVLVPLGMALLILALTLMSMLISLPLALGVCFIATAAWCLARPADSAAILIAAFVFQNLLVASISPMVADDSLFNTMRGTNFVMLMAALAVFAAAVATGRMSSLPLVRPWVLAIAGVILVIAGYFALGAARTDPMNAVVYLRNTLTPVACFVVALGSAALYRVELAKALASTAVVAAVYGYCELFFALDFLSLFNGDQYMRLEMAKQIEAGYWEKLLEETGFVLRGLDDIFRTSFFNLHLFDDVLPSVWRIGGPNFHPISFAYLLSIASTVMVFRGRPGLLLFTAPLLLVIGSKGAMVLLAIALLAAFVHRVLGPKPALFTTVAASIVWVAAAILFGMRSGDYHVLGFFAGLKEFLGGPLGQGLGIGGNVSSDAVRVDWTAAQHQGIANVPVESAVGVMLYQMGVGAFAFFGLLAGLAVAMGRLFMKTRDHRFLAGFVLIVVISANAVLQEEAWYSPLALGLALLVAGVSLGSAIRTGQLRSA